MKTLPSALENRFDAFDRVNKVLRQHHFTLGGNWDYYHGYFDRPLDEAHRVWLRIPFTVTGGKLEGEETPNPDATIRMGTPFVLKHLYNEGLDAEAVPRTYGALLDQFQDPVDQDADVEDHWVERASGILREAEQSFLS